MPMAAARMLDRAPLLVLLYDWMFGTLDKGGGLKAKAKIEINQALVAEK